MDKRTLLKEKSRVRLKPNALQRNPSKPYAYQHRGIAVSLTSLRHVLGDDVGLGKTLEALYIFSYMKAKRPTMKLLVLSEKVALPQWKEAIEEELIGMRVRIINSETHIGKDDRISAYRNFDGDILITNYNQLYRYWNVIKLGMGKEWSAIADEPNYFANSSSKMWQVGQDLFNKKPAAIRLDGLTATVVEARLEEAFGIFQTIVPGIFRSLPDFHRDFCIREKSSSGRMVTKGYTNLSQFRERIAPYFFGRLQEDPEVQQDLPEVITKDVKVVLGKEQSQRVLDTMSRLYEDPDGVVSQIPLLTAMTFSQQLTDYPRARGFDLAGAKIEALNELLKGELLNKKVIIFSKFRSVLDAYEEDLKAMSGRSYARITGLENSEEKELSKQRFMDVAANPVNTILMTQAGTRALNLQRGEVIVMINLPWTYGRYRQIVGRLKRTGSIHKRVLVIRLLGVLHPSVAGLSGSEKTFDHYTLEVLKRRLRLFNQVHEGDEQIKSSPAALKEILTAMIKDRS